MNKPWEALDWGKVHLTPLPLQWINNVPGKISIIHGNLRVRPPGDLSGAWFADGSFYDSPDILRPIASGEVLPAILEPANGAQIPGFLIPALRVAVVAWVTRWMEERDGRWVVLPRYAEGARGRTIALATVDGLTFFELRARGLAGRTMSKGLTRARQIIIAKTGGRAELFGFRVLISGGARSTTSQGSVWTPIQVTVPNDLEEAFVGLEVASRLIEMNRQGVFQEWRDRLLARPEEAPEVTEVIEEEPTANPTAPKVPPEDDMKLLQWIREDPERIARVAQALSGGEPDVAEVIVDILREAESPEEIQQGLMLMASGTDWAKIVQEIRKALQPQQGGR